jgi:hypothetical protein
MTRAQILEAVAAGRLTPADAAHQLDLIANQPHIAPSHTISRAIYADQWGRREDGAVTDRWGRTWTP